MPSEVKVANKTGELDHVENDAGIIYDTAKGRAVLYRSPGQPTQVRGLQDRLHRPGLQ